MVDEIPQYLRDAYNREIEVTLYGYSVMGGYSREFAPIKLTRKQKAQRWLSNKKWELGRVLSDKANKLGYYDDNCC